MTDFFKKMTECIENHDTIYLMTHSTPDLDGMGSAIAFNEILRKMGKECYIIAPKNLINKSLIKAVSYLEENDIVIPFIYEKNINFNGDLLIILDTQEKDLVESKSILDKECDRIVIDHHSRGINIIDDCVCSYLDDSKSSIIEIVCEYLKYLNYSLDKKYYTIMFAGLYVDTNGFSLKTSSRTFEIASFLINGGVDNEKWQSFLKNSMEDVLNMYSYIEKCVKLDKDVYLCEVSDKFCSSVELAMIANKIMKFENVKIAFAVGLSDSSTVLISARSTDKVDVSKIMRNFGGGGHYSAAAARVTSQSIESIISDIKKYVKE